MLINQNTTQDDSKKCSRKNNKAFKLISIITVILLISSMLCVYASAIVMQEISSSDIAYPALTMYIDNEENSAGIMISGRGEDATFGAVTTTTRAGDLTCRENVWTINEDYQYVFTIEYMADNANITSLEKFNPSFNIDLWEWSKKYNDTIIWQLYDYYGNNIINATYYIELPYFNNSEIMGTTPLQFEIEKVITRNNLTWGDEYDGDSFYYYNLDLPNIETIVNKAIEEMENQSYSNITFQFKGEALRENNYVTNVYSEDGTTIVVDFKAALSTVLISPSYIMSEGITEISILNYNDDFANELMSYERENDFFELFILNEFERSAEITEIRKERDVGLLNWLGNAISGIMNVEIFPNFSIGGLLSVIIMIPIILWILKLVAGG